MALHSAEDERSHHWVSKLYCSTEHDGQFSASRRMAESEPTLLNDLNPASGRQKFRKTEFTKRSSAIEDQGNRPILRHSGPMDGIEAKPGK